MACKYKAQRLKTKKFFSKSTDDWDLLRRRGQHEAERKTWGWKRLAGGRPQGSRLIWMREVRRLIAERGLDT